MNFEAGKDMLLQTTLFDIDEYAASAEAQAAFVREIYPQLCKNFEWYLRTQFGKLLNGERSHAVFRWRGRTATHCLTSGLDDYPRGKLSPYELHLDLTSWMAMYADTLSRVAKFVGAVDDVKRYS